MIESSIRSETYFYTLYSDVKIHFCNSFWAFHSYLFILQFLLDTYLELGSREKEEKFNVLCGKALHVPLADLGGEGGARRMPPMGPNSFIFGYIFTKKYPHWRSIPPPTGARPSTGNPGSATEYRKVSHIESHMCDNRENRCSKTVGRELVTPIAYEKHWTKRIKTS